MKKSVLILSVLSMLMNFSCKKSTDGNKNILMNESVEETITNENGKTDSSYSAQKTVKNGNTEIREKTFRYVAEDGSSALVTFTETDKGNSIGIRSNNKTITLPQKDSDGKTTVYENDDIEAKSEENRVTITQGNNVIELKKAKGE